MATDTRADTCLTLADLCQAIADGRLPYTECNDHYYVRASDARRIRSAESSRQDASQPDLLVDPSVHASSQNVGCSA